MRVAVTQFATTLNTQENLATCIRMINSAAVCNPSVIVLPEYCNTLPCYSDHNHAWQQALEIDGDFMRKMAELAAEHRCYVAFNVTMRRSSHREHKDASVQSEITVTSCMLSPSGELIQQSDKQLLTDYEKTFFVVGNKTAKPINTPDTKLGLVSGNDSINFEASRELALAESQLLCNGISSFSNDHSNLHSIARASENDVYFVSANKIGPLFLDSPSNEIFDPKSQITVPHEYLLGSGRSQIVAPSGKVLAKLEHANEGFIYADIDFNQAPLGLNNKKRPDGTSIIQQRRPELYCHVSTSEAKISDVTRDVEGVPETANVALFATYKSNEQAIEDVCHYIENNLSDVIQLPELFFVADKALTQDSKQREEVERLSHFTIALVSAQLRPYQYVCTSLILNGDHQAVLINEKGLLATQQQLHECLRYEWTALGKELAIIDLALEQGNVHVAMLTADDFNVPEIIQVAAQKGIHMLLVPFDIQEPSDVQQALLSRTAENRICIVAATREKNLESTVVSSESKNKIKREKSTGLIANLMKESALNSQFKLGKFKGNVNQPIVKQQHGKITKALVFPAQACIKTLALEG